MKKIIIKTCDESTHLRENALNSIIDYEENHMEGRKEGSYHGVLYIVTTVENWIRNEFQIFVYHTKTSLIADVMKRSHVSIINQEEE